MSNRKATPKQVALLTYLGYSDAALFSLDQASELIAAAGDDPALSERMSRWTTDRNELHPALYGSTREVRDRVAEITEYLAEQRAEYNEFDKDLWPFKSVPRKDVRAVVEWLDENSPTWDQGLFREFGINSDVIDGEFTEAVTAQFPHLLRPSSQTSSRARDGASAKKAREKKSDAGCGRLIAYAVITIGIVVIVAQCSK